jgi:hypothetical protein
VGSRRQLVGEWWRPSASSISYIQDGSCTLFCQCAVPGPFTLIGLNIHCTAHLLRGRLDLSVADGVRHKCRSTHLKPFPFRHPESDGIGLLGCLNKLIADGGVWKCYVYKISPMRRVVLIQLKWNVWKNWWILNDKGKPWYSGVKLLNLGKSYRNSIQRRVNCFLTSQRWL